MKYFLFNRLKCYYHRLSPPLAGLFRVLSATQQTSSSYPCLPAGRLLLKGEGRCCITNSNYITTTSTSVLYSPLSEIPITIIIYDRRGLCLDDPAIGGIWRKAFFRCVVARYTISSHTPSHHPHKSSAH